MNIEFKHKVEYDGELTGAVFVTENGLWFYRKLVDGVIDKHSPWKEGLDSPLYFSFNDLMEVL